MSNPFDGPQAECEECGFLTVGELIEQLKSYPLDALVDIEVEEGHEPAAQVRSTSYTDIEVGPVTIVSILGNLRLCSLSTCKHDWTEDD